MHRRLLRAGSRTRTRSLPRLTSMIALAATLPVVLAACTTATRQASLMPSPTSRLSAQPSSPDGGTSAGGTATSTAASTATSTLPSGSGPTPSAQGSTSASPDSTAASRTRAAASPSAAPSAARTTGSATAAPVFGSQITTVTAAQLGASWHSGCPVGPAQLRQIFLTYWGFDGTAHTGTIVVNASVVSPVIKVFAELYAERFPIRRIEPVSNFGGSDDASMAVDNTSGFNCRNAVSQGPPAWSAHAYGEAIDVNTIENPYLEGGKVLPPEGAAYAKRTPYRPGMAVAGGELVKAFAAVGWSWGGRWANSPDYQHFSSTGG
jgi:hypothetical protein